MPPLPLAASVSPRAFLLASGRPSALRGHPAIDRAPGLGIVAGDESMSVAAQGTCGPTALSTSSGPVRDPESNDQTLDSWNTQKPPTG